MPSGSVTLPLTTSAIAMPTSRSRAIAAGASDSPSSRRPRACHGRRRTATPARPSGARHHEVHDSVWDHDDAPNLPAFERLRDPLVLAGGRLQLIVVGAGRVLDDGAHLAVDLDRHRDAL